jgi:hypothetical protein
MTSLYIKMSNSKTMYIILTSKEYYVIVVKIIF